MSVKATAELAVSFVVGLGAAAGGTYYLQQALRARADACGAALEGARAPRRQLPHEALYAMPPPPKGPATELYASVRGAWNGQLDAVRRAISEIFAP
mmetsp:Transcript_12774/g.39370  ORF Transcript_12774/g.39370 Transcript_12774/m.39370 type:complete len:97 (-) Transcript_12774:32-322(-)